MNVSLLANIEWSPKKKVHLYNQKLPIAMFDSELLGLSLQLHFHCTLKGKVIPQATNVYSYRGDEKIRIPMNVETKSALHKRLRKEIKQQVKKCKALKQMAVNEKRDLSPSVVAIIRNYAFGLIQLAASPKCKEIQPIKRKQYNIKSLMLIRSRESCQTLPSNIINSAPGLTASK